MERWHKGILIVVLLALPGNLSASPPRTDTDAEDELKSVIVKNFLRYSTWPEAPAANAPITVGVLGRTSFARLLHGLLDGKPVNGRNVQVLELRTGADPRQCNLIYIALDRSADIRQALQSLRSPHTLTIGEADTFLDSGGAVNLIQIDGHMGFEFSLDALNRAGVEISARLLRLGQDRRRRAE